MKSSLLKEPRRKSRARRFSFQPLKPLENSQNVSPRRVTFQDGAANSVYLLSNKSLQKQQFTDQNFIRKKTYNQSKKLIEEINQLKENFKNGRNSRQKILYQMQKNYEKENHNVFNPTLSDRISYNCQGENATDVLLESDFFKKKVIADSFLGSFRVVFTFYVQLYFQKMTLALELKKKYFNVFTYLLKYINYKVHDCQTLVEIDELCIAIFRMIKNKNADYKIIDIKYGLKNIVQGKCLWKASDFEQVFQTIQKHSYLSNPSKFLLNMSFEQIVNAFFEVFAQFYDTQIKFKKICKANEKKLTSLLVELSINYELNVKLLAEFLYFDVKKSKNWLVMRFEEFFKDHFGTKDKAMNLLKWVKQKR